MADINDNTTINNNSSGTDVIVYICIHLVMPCAVAIGIIGNLLSILVFARREMIKFCVSIFTIVLALSDILLLTTSLFNIILPDFLGGLLSDKSAFWW
jgi:ATP/ADP translocase